MKLHYSPTSPYARKALAVAKHHGLVIELVASNPSQNPAHLLAVNPLCKIPSLETDDGVALNDSPIICEYLDHLGQGPKLFPAPGPARWRALALAALADGILDAAVPRRGQQAFPMDEGRSAMVGRFQSAMSRTVDALEGVDLSGPLDIGKLGVVVALGYLDFRYAQEPWRPGHPKLEAFYAEQMKNPIFSETAPPPA